MTLEVDVDVDVDVSRGFGRLLFLDVYGFWFSKTILFCVVSLCNLGQNTRDNSLQYNRLLITRTKGLR